MIVVKKKKKDVLTGCQCNKCQKERKEGGKVEKKDERRKRKKICQVGGNFLRVE